MAEAIVIRAPLPLSRDFIDYPYLTFLGTCQAASVLAGAGWRTRIHDGLTAPAARLQEKSDGFWLGIEPDNFLASLQKIQADLVVIHLDTFLRTARGLLWVDQVVRSLAGSAVQVRVLAEMVTGGMHELGLGGGGLLERWPEIDLVMKYEGERLLERLSPGSAPPRRGVWEESEAFPLDDLPPPAFGMLDMESTFSFLGRVLASPVRPGPFPAGPERTLPLVTSRGCPYGCVFCSGRPGLGSAGRQVRAVPWERVEEWMERWCRDFGLQRVVILDDVANLDPARFGAMLTTLERLRLRVEFPNGLRADRLRHEDVRRLSRLTGQLKVSLESASPRVQKDVLHKNLDPESVERVAEWCQSEDLGLQVHCLVGVPGESREEINQTLKMAVWLAQQYGTQPLVQFAVPLPGTELESICRDGGYLKDVPEDWHAGFTGRPLIETGEFDRRFLERATASLRRVLSPQAHRKVIVNLTYRCNNHCVFCAVGDRPARDADTSEVLAALESYRKQGYRLLDIDGGEPTLHPDLFDVVAAGRRMGYERITVVTNGRRLSYRAFARQMAQSGVDEVLISLHASDAGLQADITGSPESFEQTVGGLNNILGEMGPDNVAVNTTLVRANLDDVHRLAEMLKKAGVRRWNLQVVTPFGRAQASQVPDPEWLKHVLSGLLDSLTPGIRIQVINCPPCLLPGHEEAAAADFQKASRDMVFVGESGENLQAFLSNRRAHDRRCRECPYVIQCPGHYVFEESG